MFIVAMNGLTMTRAEEVVASIWCALEEYNVVSPRMSIDEVAGRLNVFFTFRTQADAALVMRAVPLLAPPDDAKAPLLMAAGWAN